jgi:tetratricopeptide (TPR) repeat protein
MGDIYNSKQMYSAAIPCYAHLVALSPKLYDGYSKLSYDYFLVKLYDQSLAVNKQALMAIPAIPQPMINIGRIFITMNKPDSALIYLNAANKLLPNNPEIQNMLSQIKNKSAQIKP